MHYESVLGQALPTYIAQLNAELAISKNAADMAILYLTTTIICDTCAQVLVGELADCQLVPLD